METNDIIFVQNQIGYEFSNSDLLQQAFIRRSYANENGGQDNEVLEFIGDKVLDYVVVKILCSRFGRMTSEAEWNEYQCQYSEGKLTEMKKNLVQRSYLADRIQMLDLEQFLIMGQSDCKQNVQNEDSVQEDLFEAILGAIAIDSNWDMQALQDAVEIMLNPDESFEGDENYVELIQEWTLRDSGSTPLYYFEKGSYSSTWYSPFQGVSQTYKSLNGPEVRELQQSTYRCLLKISNDLPAFRGFARIRQEKMCVNWHMSIWKNMVICILSGMKLMSLTKIRQLTSLRYWQGGDIFRFQPMILRKNMMKTEIRYGIAAA